MVMKRRNRKRSSKAANPPKIASNVQEPVSLSGIPSDAEKLASSLEIPSNAENPAGPSVALAGADRRIHPRYKFSAAVELDGRRSEEHTSELQSRLHLVCRLLLEKKKKRILIVITV